MTDHRQIKTLINASRSTDCTGDKNEMILGKWSPSDHKSLHQLETIKIPHMSQGERSNPTERTPKPDKKCIKSPLHQLLKITRPTLALILSLVSVVHIEVSGQPPMDRRVRVIIGWNYYRQRAVNLKYTWEPNYLNWNRLVEVEWLGDLRQRDDPNLVHFSSPHSLVSTPGITSYHTLDNIGMPLEVGTLIS